MAQEKIVRGDDLMLFDSLGKSLAFATNHTLTLTADVMETSSKDSGKWKANQATKLSFEVSTENLYTVTNYNELVTKMMNREEIEIYFAVKADEELNLDGLTAEKTEWNKGKAGYKGKVIISNITANANSGENATYSTTLTGTGALTAYNEVA